MSNNAKVRPAFFNSRGAKKNRGRVSLQQMKSAQMGGGGRYGLKVFRELAEKKQWGKIHSGHYDWWMFPIEDGSQTEYNVFENDVRELQGDAEYMANYREAVRLVVRAWGWDIDRAEPVTPFEQTMGWTHWDVRLAKITRSLWLFEQRDYLESIQTFARHLKPNGGFRYGGINLDEILHMKLPRDARRDEL
eukprot:TRINITY_DN2360_c0_g1_i1.p1 TRINITY_DN2360_c0_g1~~TRINITY_DN2360_c0_g1_i1.p1  ORF type:complete len:191 (+),score=74.50 TRINITY_DN2360_c0_g1_i1:55-627(+)